MSRRGLDLLTDTGAVRGDQERRPIRRTALAGILGLAAVGASAALHPPPRLIWNASASVPVGLYWRAAEPVIRRGDLVLAKLPEPMRQLAAERGYLPANVPLVKRVAAVPGDRICEIGTDIWINGRIAARRLAVDRRGRVLPVWNFCGELPGGMVFLLVTGVPDSFDGRYFGPIEMRRIVGRLVPLWTR
jgi:conjugative transfer signal peptidase TraF